MTKILLLVAWISCLASPAFAAIAILDAPANSNSEDCDPCTANMTISAGSNRIFMCAVTAEDAASGYNLSGMTFNGVAMTLAIAAESLGTDQNIAEIWYLLDASLPAPGTYSVSVDFTESLADFGITCWSVSGAAQAAPKDTDSFASSAETTATLSLTGVVSTDWTFTAAVHNAASNTWTHGSGQTEMSDFCFGATPSACGSTSREAGEAGPSSTSSGSTGANRFAMIGAVWAEAASTVIPTSPIFFP